MEDIVSQFKADLNTHFNGFLIHVSKRYRVNLKQLFADFEKYQAGKLEVLQGTPPLSPKKVVEKDKKDKKAKQEPVKTAKVIKDLIGDDDSISDEQSEVKTKVKKLNNVIDSSDDGTKSDDEDENTVSLSDDSDDIEESEEVVDLGESGSGESEESEEVIDLDDDEPLPKIKKERIIIQEPPSEDDEEDEDDEPSESEPKPKTEKKAEKDKKDKKNDKDNKDNKDNKKNNKKDNKKDNKKSIDDVSDKPRTATQAKVPEGTLFLKGTNLVVVKGKVVAAVGKNGFTKLNARNLKSFDTPAYSEIKYDVWDKEKIEKKFK